MHTRVHAHTHALMHAHTHALMHVHTHTPSCMHVHTHTHMYSYTHTHTQTHTHTHTHKHKHTHTHTHTHTHISVCIYPLCVYTFILHMCVNLSVCCHVYIYLNANRCLFLWEVRVQEVDGAKLKSPHIPSDVFPPVWNLRATSWIPLFYFSSLACSSA